MMVVSTVEGIVSGRKPFSMADAAEEDPVGSAISTELPAFAAALLFLQARILHPIIPVTHRSAMDLVKPILKKWAHIYKR